MVCLLRGFYWAFIGLLFNLATSFRQINNEAKAQLKKSPAKNRSFVASFSLK
jgi:hypothetical protein